MQVHEHYLPQYLTRVYYLYVCVMSIQLLQCMYSQVQCEDICLKGGMMGLGEI